MATTTGAFREHTDHPCKDRDRLGVVHRAAEGAHPMALDLEGADIDFGPIE